MRALGLLGVTILALILFGCSSNSVPSMESITAELGKVDVGIADFRQPERNPESPLPNSYKDHIEFSISEVAPKGGQVFICDKKEYCDALFAYFDAFKALAGPYIYRSKSGLVVAQLNSGLRPETAEKVKAVIDRY